LSFANDGLRIGAGSMGTFTLRYPKLIDRDGREAVARTYPVGALSVPAGVAAREVVTALALVAHMVVPAAGANLTRSTFLSA
jgi:hypothetical protein